MKHKILIVLTLVAFASCMKLKKKGGDEAATEAQPPAQEQLQAQEQQHIESVGAANDKLTYVYLPATKQDNVDKVQFKAASNWPDTIRIRKDNGTSKTEITVKFEKGCWTDTLPTESKVTYKFYAEVDSQLVLMDEIELLPALDIHLTEDFNLAQKFKLNDKIKVLFFKNLTLEEKTHLYIENYSGQIIVQNLNSNFGAIQTFPQDGRAANDVDGRSGGIVQLRIIDGNGVLNIVMKGQHGGNGSPALPPDAAMKGADGSRGVPADFILTPINDPNVGSFEAYTCTRSPGSGGDGKPGLKGNPGHDGKDGGNSGIVTVDNSSALQVTQVSLAGSKGLHSEGGAGGQGGAPGVGGDGAENDLALKLGRGGFVTGRCPSAINGNPGAPGGPGNDGIDGHDGLVQK